MSYMGEEYMGAFNSRSSRLLGVLAVLPSVALSSITSAASYDVGGAHVTIVEGTYSPSSIRFAVDTGAGRCGPGTFLFFSPRGDNDTQKSASASAVMASLLTAMTTKTTISFGGDDASCTVSYVYNH